MLWSNKPSTKYESKNLGSWTSTTDVENFFSAHNVENGFSGIKIGNYVTIQDGTYNTQWVVAGFTCEHNATASDGTTYDNGIGMLMIPKTKISSGKWNSNTAVSYINSTMHTSTLVTAANNLKSVLGNHIVQRNVLLGSEQNGTSPKGNTTSAYTWTTAYLTLMSIGQMNGTFGSNTNQYDDGEANYKLPLFNYENYWLGSSSSFWSRCVWGLDGENNFYAWTVGSDGSASHARVNITSTGVRPLMLLR